MLLGGFMPTRTWAWHASSIGILKINSRDPPGSRRPSINDQAMVLAFWTFFGKAKTTLLAEIARCD
jgi:hypothetical protein